MVLANDRSKCSRYPSQCVKQIPSDWHLPAKFCLDSERWKYCVLVKICNVLLCFSGCPLLWAKSPFHDKTFEPWPPSSILQICRQHHSVRERVIQSESDIGWQTCFLTLQPPPPQKKNLPATIQIIRSQLFLPLGVEVWTGDQNLYKMIPAIGELPI